MTRSVAITGATGYLGSRLEGAFSRAGWSVTRVIRSANRPGDRRLVLGEPVDPRIFDGIDVVIHAAYDMRAISADDIWRINVTGTKKLLDAASAAHVDRVIVLSSMSAYDGTRQRYGRAKLDIEAATLAHGGAVVRPGIVVGKEPGGMAGTLARLTRLPVTPALVGVGAQFPVLEEDFILGNLALAEQSTLPSHPVGLAHGEPLTFSALLRGIAARIGVRPPRIVPVPWRTVDAALKLGEAMKVPLPLRSDSLLGLLEPASFVPHIEYWASLGVNLRPLRPQTAEGIS